jgi:hypothetical protein
MRILPVGPGQNVSLRTIVPALRADHAVRRTDLIEALTAEIPSFDPGAVLLPSREPPPLPTLVVQAQAAPLTDRPPASWTAIRSGTGVTVTSLISVRSRASAIVFVSPSRVQSLRIGPRPEHHLRVTDAPLAVPDIAAGNDPTPPVSTLPRPVRVPLWLSASRHRPFMRRRPLGRVARARPDQSLYARCDICPPGEDTCSLERPLAGRSGRSDVGESLAQSAARARAASQVPNSAVTTLASGQSPLANRRSASPPRRLAHVRDHSYKDGRRPTALATHASPRPLARASTVSRSRRGGRPCSR